MELRWRTHNMGEGPYRLDYLPGQNPEKPMTPTQWAIIKVGLVVETLAAGGAAAWMANYFMGTGESIAVGVGVGLAALAATGAAINYAVNRERVATRGHGEWESANK